MMICGFRKRAFFIRFLVVLVLSSVFGGVNAFSVVRSDVDAFSNPDAASCSRVGCLQVRRSNGCKSGNCCICKCRRNAPNYLIDLKECVKNDDVGDCDFISTSSEIAVVDISKAGNVLFEDDAEKCSSGLQVMQWSYRLDRSRWIKGQPNNFTVNAKGSYRWSLQWNTGLDAKYSGLILKFNLKCAGHSGYTKSRCLLVKSRGNYTLSETSNPPLQASPSDVAVDVTGRKVEPTERIKRNDTVPGDINNVDRRETAAESKREIAEKNNSVVAVGVCLSLVAGVALICVVVLRRSGSTWSKGRGNAGDVAYEEPVDPTTRYADVKRNSTTFHNEFYDADCVLSIEGQTNTRMSRLGSLPPLPTEEGIYEEPVIARNVGYQGLARETRESNEQTKDEPAIEEEPPPVYNTLEPPSDDDDVYDDTDETRTNHIHIILGQTKDEPAIEEEPPPVYNTLEPPSDDDDDYDDTDETRCRTV